MPEEFSAFYYWGTQGSPPSPSLPIPWLFYFTNSINRSSSPPLLPLHAPRRLLLRFRPLINIILLLFFFLLIEQTPKHFLQSLRIGHRPPTQPTPLRIHVCRNDGLVLDLDHPQRRALRPRRKDKKAGGTTKAKLLSLPIETSFNLFFSTAHYLKYKHHY